MITATDHVAIGVLHAARRLGISVPGQMSVVGFDDIHLSSYTAPPLTTLHNPIAEMARLAVDLALDRPAGAGTDHVLAPVLVVRESTGPPPA